MLIDFFFTLKSAKVPVSIKEFLVLLEALERQVISPSLDDFYYLSRTALVKDEAHFDNSRHINFIECRKHRCIILGLF